MKKQYVVAIDVGGTNIKFGIVNAQGALVTRRSCPTRNHSQNPKTLIAAMAKEVLALLKDQGIALSKVAGIGIGLPGLVDAKKGEVIFLPNIPGWNNIPLAKLLNKLTGLPVYIDNDVKMITLGEASFGAGRGVSHMVCLTLGTGVGAGLVLNGRLYRGAANAAGELGHMPLNQHGPECNCGGQACFERYVGNKSLLALAQQITKNKDITLELMHQKAKAKDAKALAFWKEAATLIGDGLVGLVNLLNPQLIVIGGGVSNNESFLFPTIRAVIKARCMSLQGSMVKIKRAHFKDDAGLIGAYVLVMHADQR